MPLSDYTPLSAVRAALGLSVKELPDVVLEDDLYLFSLRADLRTVATGALSSFESVKAQASVTESESAFLDSVMLFSAYSVARQCSTVLANTAVKSLTDGKAGFIRHSDKSQLQLQPNIQAEYERYRQQLQDVYALYLGTANTDTLPALLKVSSPGFDPVTG